MYVLALAQMLSRNWEVGSMGVDAGLHVQFVVKKFTFPISL